MRALCCLVLLLCSAALISDSTALSIDDNFIAGYATAVIEREFNLSNVSLHVENGIIKIGEKDVFQDIEHDELVKELLAIEGVRGVEIAGILIGSDDARIGEEFAEQESVEKEEDGEHENLNRTVFLPRGFLFDPMIADPRWPHFSFGYQYYVDDDEFESVGAVSFGESFSLVRGSAPFDGQWELGIQAAVFSVFDLDATSYDLINADYWVGIPATYRRGGFSTLVRLFHQSSHLGDEYLLRNTVKRINLSYEGVDLKLSHDIGRAFRIYYGGGVLFDTTPSDFDPLTVQYGFEVEYPGTFLSGTLSPVFAVDCKNWEELQWNMDTSVRCGIQLENKARFIGHKIQLMIEYYNGHSPNGQFYLKQIEYLGLGTHFYF